VYYTSMKYVILAQIQLQSVKQSCNILHAMHSCKVAPDGYVLSPYIALNTSGAVEECYMYLNEVSPSGFRELISIESSCYSIFIQRNLMIR
jgi:hypothetical protein